MNLLERLQLFPGGLAGLAQAAGISTPVAYRFAWREHRKTPIRLADKIAAAIRRRRSAPALLRELGDLEELLVAWKAAQRTRVRGDAPDEADAETAPVTP